MAVIFGERMSIIRAVAIALCLVGAALVSFSSGTGGGLGGTSAFPAGVALAGAGLGAVETLLIKSPGRSEKTLTLLAQTANIRAFRLAEAGVGSQHPDRTIHD